MGYCIDDDFKTLLDFIISSDVSLLRSGIFNWNEFCVSAGRYELREDTMIFRHKDGMTFRIGENVKNWFVAEDESIFFDGDTELDINGFTRWSTDQTCCGAVDEDGFPVYIDKGWMVRMNRDGSVSKLVKAPDHSCFLSVYKRTVYLDRFYKDSDITYKEAYSYDGTIRRKESDELFEASKNRIIFRYNKNMIERNVRDALDYANDHIIKHLQFCYRSILSIEDSCKSMTMLMRYTDYLFYLKHKRSSHSKIADHIAAMLINKDEDIEINEYRVNFKINNRPIPDMDDDSICVIESYKESARTVGKMLKRLSADCPAEDIMTVFNDAVIMGHVFRFYEMMEKSQKEYSAPCEKTWRNPFIFSQQ